jgi:hypothetical protein
MPGKTGVARSAIDPVGSVQLASGWTAEVMPGERPSALAPRRGHSLQGIHLVVKQVQGKRKGVPLILL